MANKRRTIELLPGHLRTETLSKMFEATVDHLFQPESVEFLTGYIGSKPAWYNSTKDFYLSEPTKYRQDYQLSPTIVSKDYQSGQITNALFYEDLLGQLRFQGALTDNHSRLFEQEYYSWSPPIDTDKFVNFTNYYWLPSGPDAIELLNLTDANNDIIGQTAFEYSGAVKYAATGETMFVDIRLTSGMKIIFRNDKTVSLNDISFIVEGVGREISLVELSDSANPGWDVLAWDIANWDGAGAISDKQYVTISRESIDGNQWSDSNRWFHIDNIEQSKTTSDDRFLQQARRPIIEFDKNIELWNYGTNNKGIIDLIDNSNGNVFETVVGQSSWIIDGVSVRDGMRVLIVADENSTVNNRIYTIAGQEAGYIQLIDEGVPVNGDRLSVKYGDFQGYNLYYNGTNWTSSGQQKTGTNPPLFSLYDIDGNSLADPSVYPSSTFAGSKVFSYSVDSNQPIDSELNINVKVDQFGDYVFSNNISIDTVSYLLDGQLTAYTGYLFANVNGEYVNSWYKSPNSSRQYIVNEFVVDNSSSTFVIDQSPAPQLSNTLPNIIVTSIYIDGTERALKNNIDYVVIDNTVNLLTALQPDSRLIIKSWNSATPTSITGYYELPKNISANPNNELITTVSRSQFLQQFVQIIENQTGIIGNTLGSNNFRDTKKTKGLGLSILQHRAPMLKLGSINTTKLTDLTTTVSQTDPILAMQYAQKSYQRFYNRFLQALFAIAKKQGYTAGSSVTACDPYTINTWVSAALQQINIGKSQNSPWANSGQSGTPGAYCSVQSTSPTYVPATPTRLGIMPAYKPIVYMDTSYTVPQLVIQTHDGSRIVMVNEQGDQLGSFVHGQSSTINPEELTDPVAASWLQFELDLFNNLPESYKNSETTLVFDVREYSPGKWRTSDYSRDDLIKLQRPHFDKWTISNQIDYRANTGYVTTNQFTYNYRNVTDKQGQPVPGHWQGIYRWFYDTDRPHTHPWEMLGFSQKPSWWDGEYGSAPYTNGNIALWNDLRDGIIRKGDRQGTYITWARPGLMSCIPVDSQGSLLPPYLAGCVASIPDVYSSSSEWIFGDGSPVESVWTSSQEYSFVMAQVSYLMKPARFLEYTWDSLRTKHIFKTTDNGQWVYINTNSRRSSNQFYVHRETPISLSTGTTVPNESNLAYFGSCGFQHWVSEYLISQGLSVTSYLGNIIRGSTVQLAHRMAGYVNSASLRTTVDSFGELGYNSQFIPNENTNVYLYRSASIGESVYSGILIEQVKNGWRIYGYDSVSQVFNTIPSNLTGAKKNIVIGNQRVTEYQSGLDAVKEVLYGTVLSSRQDVYDFIIGYGRWLTAQGWRFEQYSDDSNVILNWSQSAQEYLFWSQGSWENGTFITVSPSADTVSYYQKYGNIQYVNGIVSGAYPVVDRSGAPIQPQHISVNRVDGGVTVKPINTQGIFGLRLYRTTLEHALFFDNTTAFGDVVYQPLYDLKQDRIKIYGYRANDWNGRIDAPGYFITQNENTGTWSMTTNFEATASGIEKYFNVEQPKNFLEINSTTGGVIEKSTELGTVARPEISDLTKHLIGYQPRKYMQNLLLEDATQFEFYKGFIKQKGTKATLDSLLRNTAIIPANSSFDYFEEWLIRIGQYGATSLNNVIEFKLMQSKFVSDPQWIRLFSNNDSDYHSDDVIDIVPGDPAIVVPPESYQDKLFSLRSTYSIDQSTDLPTAGYPMLGETSWMVVNSTELLNLYSTQQNTLVPVNEGDSVWQFITDTGSWTTWKLSKAISDIDVTIPSQVSGVPTVVATVTEHGLLDGDICVIYGIAGLSLLNGTYVISNVTAKTFQINVSTYEQGIGGTILVYRPTRFATTFDRDSGEPPNGWSTGDLAYVDEGGIETGAWTVYKRLDNKWISYRQQEYKVASNLLLESKLFDSSNGSQVIEFNYHNPIQGRVSGRADAEISYKTDYDPAKYNKGNTTGYALSESEAWSSAQLGLVWWDLSTIRYIDYEQGDDRYRVQHWGKIAPGTSVDVYEWVRSPVSPTDWASYVAEGTAITDGGRSFTPSGTIRNPTNPSWSEVIEYGTGNTSTTYYYFWVKNSAMPPAATTRKLTTQNISNLIAMPSTDDRPWYAAISERSLIIGNAQRLLNGDKIVQHIKYSTMQNENNVYGEWELIREGDPSSPINDIVWNKLSNSLTTFDGLGNDVPDYHLNALQKYGTTVRPRQTWFKNREAASKVFVDTFNSLIASNVTPMVDDASMSGWSMYFDAAEPEPLQLGTWNYRVNDIAQRDSLVGAIAPDQIVLVGPVSTTNNLWTMWKYNSSTLEWELTRRQGYNTANYWKYVDWYLAGYSSSTLIDIVVDTNADLDQIVAPDSNTIAKVLDNGNNKWQLFTWTTEWKLIAQQDGNIEILPSIYLWTNGFDYSTFDTAAFDITAAIEFSNIIDGIKSAIYPEQDSIELNTLLFAMINYVLSEQQQVDWLIKTSNIVLKGFDQPLLPAQLLAADNIDSILGFVNEAKPYHAKIREFISGKSILDIADVRVDDFDSYLADTALTRKINATLIFDRVSTPNLRRGWGYNWDVTSWDDGAGQSFGAIDRIEQFYEPSPGMIPKIIEDLMSGVAYKGMILNSLGFNDVTGWGIGPWGGLIGWDADPSAIEMYLDQIIQGGQVPNYDSGIGTGSVTSFPITNDVMTPHNVVVWSDGALRAYGVDWIIPTYAQSIYVINGGTGYSVGDYLDILGGTGLANTRIQVTSVSFGRITAAKIVGRGSYNTVLSSPYQVEYPPSYLGTGIGATFGVDWYCGEIKFFTAPTSSAVPNVYMLYIGTTYGSAPTTDSDTIYDGNEFIQPFVDNDRPEELYPMRARDALSIDVITSPVGGRPIVTAKAYITDGVTDQYDLSVTPQNNEAITVYLDGAMLTYGATNDYVINYETNRLVFVSTPLSDKLLNIFTIGTGGSSRLVNSVSNVNPGIGYVPGDDITLVNNVGQIPATIKVSTVKAIDAAIIDGGAGYFINDELILETGDGIQDLSTATILKITEVDQLGGILSVEIINSGSWSILPTNLIWDVTRIQQPSQLVDIDISWGAETATILSPGRYARIVYNSVPQATPPTSGGTGATWNLFYDHKLSKHTFTGNGSNTDYIIDNITGFNANQFLVTINGVITTAFTMLSNGIRFDVAPDYAADILVTVFPNSEFSIVNETAFIANTSVQTYTLDQSVFTTIPTYLSSLVTVNGELLNPPIMKQFVGNGQQDAWQLPLEFAGGTSIDVFVDQQLQVNGLDYTISGSLELEFTEIVPVNADIQLVRYNTDVQYIVYGNEITFNGNVVFDGDNVSVMTYSQDIDYEFHMEPFYENINNVFVLGKIPSDTNTIRVWKDGVLLTHIHDYTLMIGEIEIEIGWDVSGWDVSGWDLLVINGANNIPVIKVVIPSWTIGDDVVITYMTGLPEKPATIWRTLTAGQTSLTTSIDPVRQTISLSNVYTFSSSIEIEDHTKITHPIAGIPSYVYINTELIGFTEIQFAPSISNPNRAFLKGLQRNRMGTSGNPRAEYNVQFYNGDGSTLDFPTEAAGQAISRTVWVNEQIQVENVDYTFEILLTPTPGEYVRFVSPPITGFKNVKLVSLNKDSVDQTISHVALSTVIDAGSNVTLPVNYTWEPTRHGLQYSNSPQALFFLDHGFK